MTLKKAIIDYLKQQPKNFSINRLDLAKKLQIKEHEYQLFFKALNILEKEQMLTRKADSTYELFNHDEMTVGTLRTNARGFGFVSVENDMDYFVKSQDMLNAIDGDSVRIKKVPDPMHPGQYNGLIIKVEQRANLRQVGEIIEFNQTYFQVQPDNKHFLGTLLVAKKDNAALVVGSKVVVVPIEYLVENQVVAKVIEYIGHVNDPKIDIVSIVKQFDIETEFSNDVMQEVAAVPDEVEQDAKHNRTVLTDRIIITIDGADAKDLDDAISLEKLSNGNYQLGVHIADVAAYVKMNSAIDATARARGTSVYLADRVIPMLPHKLSNGICSLNPQVERLTMSCDMEITPQGEFVHTHFYEAVIQTTERMTYTDVNEMLEHPDSMLIQKYQHIYPMVQQMDQLAKVLRQQRFERGSLDFDLDEAKIIVDANGKAIDIEKREQGISEKIIEEFMIAANEAVATHFTVAALPFIYRTHGLPKDSKLDTFKQVANHAGVKTQGVTNGASLTPKKIQRLLQQFQQKTEHNMLAMLLLRTMQKAEYTTTNIGHFGLASTSYTHFTSPIRRYPDLMVHRLIKHFILKIPQFTDAEATTQFFESIAHSSSVAERKAIDCERAVTSMKMAEFMESHIGDTYDGVISGTTSSGMFVELDNLVEGRVGLETMVDDFYIYSAETLTFIGRRTHKQFRMGDKIKIEVIAASKKNATIDFKIVGMKSNKPKFSYKRQNNNKQKDRNKTSVPSRAKTAHHKNSKNKFKKK